METTDKRYTRREIVGGSAGAVALAASGLLTVNIPMTAAADIVPHRITPLDISQVTITDDFWSPRLKLWREVTIADCFGKFERDRGGAINNFDLLRDGKTGTHAGPPWYDGLIYEMIRGSADYLAAKRDSTLETRLDGYIARIVAAQAADNSGYINTWTQMMLPQTQRWGMNGGDDREQHDIYNAGMMIEAGVHYYRATGRAVLLEAATRMADVMCRTIGLPPRANVIPGHSGPEEALVKLYLLFRDDASAAKIAKLKGDPTRYLELAEFFIDMRGRYEGRTSKEKSFGAFGQDQAVLADQTSLEGHAVRAALFCTSIAALANVTNRAEYLSASTRFWNSLADHKMYISGAAGAIAGDEKLGADYFLPNDGYMETCAAVALGFFSSNMNQLFADAKYVDVLERALYNAIPGGVALTGDHYYYQNPLTGENLRRWEWHGCPCCPPMFLKITGALPGLIYASDSSGVYVNLFIGSDAKLKLKGVDVGLKLHTKYPWNGRVLLQVAPTQEAEFDLNIRIPDWCSGANSSEELYQDPSTRRPLFELLINGKNASNVEKVRGYARLRRTWRTGDEVQLVLPMEARRVKANAKVAEDSGRVAVMLGPVLYCAEAIDNPERLASLAVTPDTRFSTQHNTELLGGVTVVRGNVKEAVVVSTKTNMAPAELTMVPFYASANREPCAMRVWLAADEEKAVPSTLAMRSKASASHCWHLDSVSAINDGFAPQRSSDNSQSRLSWWDHKGTQEWAQLDFPGEAVVKAVRVYWFADLPVSGGCDMPASWRLLYRHGDAWMPVETSDPYRLAVDEFNLLNITSVRTTALRIEVQLKVGWSGGIYEWEVIS